MAIVTDQHPQSGIGVYASQLYTLVRKDLPSVELFNMYYFPVDLPPEWKEFPGHRHAQSFAEMPMIRRLNRSNVLKSGVLEGYGIHLCGADYSLVAASPSCLATVHDYYLRRPDRTLLSEPRLFLTEAATAVQFMVSPRDLSRCQAIVSISNTTQRDLMRRLGIDSTVIHHWYDPSRFFVHDKQTARRRLGLGSDDVILLSVGAGSLNKNRRLLSRLAQILPSSYLVVKVGAPVAERGGRIFNRGRVSDEDYPLYFSAADLYVQTSTSEGFGRPLLEAMAASLPVVATRTPSAVEVLGDAGILIDIPATPLQFASAIQAAIESKQGGMGLTDRARLRAQLFSPERAREEYLSLYRRTILI